MKRLFTILTAIAIFACLLTGCSKPAPEENEESTAVPIETTEPESVTATGEAPLLFSTTDIRGEKVSSENFRDAKVIMLNFWESWCGPCVNEMPELEKLYQNYKDKGFVIIGAYTTHNDEENVTEILEKTGVTYPIISATENMYRLMTEYVPTTVFLDSKGNVLTEEPIIGANSYEEWANIIEGYLN